MSPRSQTDEWLMAHVAQGHREHLEPLVRRHASSLLTFIQRMVGDRHRGEELFQEVFLTVWIKRGQYDLIRPFKPWLYTIALNKCRAVHRSRQPVLVNLSQEADDHRSTGNSPVEQAIAMETAAQVTAAVGRLPEKQRAVVALHVWQGLPYSEIAEMLECTEATARSHMSHGLAALRKQLTRQIAGVLEDEPRP